MSSRPLSFSVITPSFNSERYIEQSILSLKSQNYPEIEQIIVDGGSTDGTIEIVKRYARNSNIKWISEHDNGVNAAVNKGFKLASGDVVSVLCSDDLYLPWTIATVAEAFKRNPGSRFIYGDDISHPMNSDLGRLMINPSEKRLKTVYRGSCLATPPFFFRREVFLKMRGFDESFNQADYDFVIRVIKNFKGSRVREALHVWRYRKDSQSQNVPKDKVKLDTLRIQKRNFPNESTLQRLFSLFYSTNYNLGGFMSGDLMLIFILGLLRIHLEGYWDNSLRHNMILFPNLFSYLFANFCLGKAGSRISRGYTKASW